MANYQITNRTGAQVKAALDNFTSAADPKTLKLTGTATGVHLFGGLGSIAAGSTDTLSNSIGVHSLSVGNDTEASGNYSTALGIYTKASGAYSCAIGCNTKASEKYSYAEGNETIASGECCHAEGNETTASGIESHAEGNYSVASGKGSHAEGGNYSSNGTSRWGDWEPETDIIVKGPLARGI